MGSPARTAACGLMLTCTVFAPTPGDLDGNGVPDLAVGAKLQDSIDAGAMIIILFESDWAVKAAQLVQEEPTTADR